MSILVVAEHDGTRIRKGTLSALQFAREVAEVSDSAVNILVLGSGVDAVVDEASQFGNVIVADGEVLSAPIAERLAPFVAEVARQKEASWVVAAASGWAKDVIGRAAGLLDGAMASDVLGHNVVEEQVHLRRPMNAGEVEATVVLHGEIKIATVRSSGYIAATVLTETGSIEELDLGSVVIPTRTIYGGVEAKGGGRPDSTEADIVVSGGRAFKTTADYEENVGTLADTMGAAAGASRALVDEGLVSNELQIGQTGKIVAPNLYIALGLSGAIQHLAGISNSKVIVAVNKDPEAPIFSVSNYGMIGDVYAIVPELIEKLSR